MEEQNYPITCPNCGYKNCICKWQKEWQLKYNIVLTITVPNPNNTIPITVVK